MKFFSAFIIAIWLFAGFCEIGNIVKLVQCDWSDTGSWKGEIIHGIGLVPGVSIVTFWFDDK